MPSPSNVPDIVWSDAGITLPSSADIYAGEFADINAAFGGGLSTDARSPQAQLATYISALIADRNAQIAFLVNQIDPLYASGRFQEAIGRISGNITRTQATATTVQATLGGLYQTVVPAGALAQDTNGNSYKLAGAVTIGQNGTVLGTFVNIKTGAIPCPARTLTQVGQFVSGWDSVTNAAAGVLGADEESRSAFEYRREASVFVNGQGNVAGVQSAVFAVPGVVDVYVTDNKTGATVSTGVTNYPIIANSIYVAAIGGADADVAQAIYSKINPGCAFNGNTTVTIADTSYKQPQPTYVIKFQRPTNTPVYFVVNIVANNKLPTNINALIRAAIEGQFSGSSNQADRERIGATIYSSKYYSAISGVASNVAIQSVFVGTAANPATTSVTMGIDQAPVTGDAYIVINQV